MKNTKIMNILHMTKLQMKSIIGYIKDPKKNNGDRISLDKVLKIILPLIKDDLKLSLEDQEKFDNCPVYNSSFLNNNLGDFELVPLFDIRNLTLEKINSTKGNPNYRITINKYNIIKTEIDLYRSLLTIIYTFAHEFYHLYQFINDKEIFLKNLMREERIMNSMAYKSEKKRMKDYRSLKFEKDAFKFADKFIYGHTKTIDKIYFSLLNNEK